MRIGESLKRARLISDEELEMALNEQEKTHDRLGDIVIRRGFVSTDKMTPFLAEYFQVPLIALKEIYKDIKPEVIEMVPADLASRLNVLPIEITNGILSVALADPLNIVAKDTLRIRTGHKIKCLMATESDLREAIDYCYSQQTRLKDFVDDYIKQETIDESQEEDSEKLRQGAYHQPVVKYVQSLIIQAVHGRASDILLQPKENNVDLRFRIDGVLYHNEAPPKAMVAAIATRIKILSGLDIAERRIPQDGRFRIKVGPKEVDIRTSTFPTIYGESVVLRLLDTSNPLLGIEQLGFEKEDFKRYKRMIKQPYGLILVTGPTGSGKTTTLYTTLNEIKSSEKNILTLEDPVEYRLPFIQQTQVNAAIGFDFARGLRSILRQDPDIIMVGEIRDRETAEIAINAALTGHLVFSTLHTNDAAGAAIRLVNMGVEPFLISSSLLGVVAQRLVRTVCPHCRETGPADPEDLARLSLNFSVKSVTRGKGCPKCFHSGYMGRKGVFEVMEMSEQIGRVILENQSTDKVRSLAQDGGMTTMRDNAIEKLKAGLTTPEEVIRVTLHNGD